MSADSAPQRWTWGVPPAQLELDCGGSRHRVVWRWGKVVLVDHHLGAERALVALGGERPACFDVLDSWRDACAWKAPAGVAARRRLSGELERVLTLAQLARFQRELRRSSEPHPRARSMSERLLREVRAALAASTVELRRAGGPKLALAVRPLLADPRAAPHGLEAPEPSLDIEGTPAQLRIEAALPIEWLVDVWGRELATVDGALVLEVVSAEPDGRRASVVALSWIVEDRNWMPVVQRCWVGLDDGGEWHRLDDDAPGPRPPRMWWSVRVRS
ncbi:MAG: hypothetical protein OEY23_06520 [Acidimicrobiia bacterium]|nr:hypothetical protein [Acidimicrobiia bacterium]